DGAERVEGVGAACTVEGEVGPEAEAQACGSVTSGLFDVVAVLRDFADFRAVVGRSVRVTIELGCAGAEDGGAHVTVVVQAVGTVDIERVSEHAANEVVDRDGTGDAKWVRLESCDAVFQRSDGRVLRGIGCFEGSNAVAQGDLVTAQEDDELADVGDIAAVALDGGIDAGQVGRRSNDAALSCRALESVDVAGQELEDAVDGSDLFGVLTAEGVRLAGQVVGCVGACCGGVGLGLGSVDGDTLRCDLVLQIAEDRRIDSAAGQVGLKLVETGGVACYFVGKPGDGAFGGGQAHALGGDV